MRLALLRLQTSVFWAVFFACLTTLVINPAYSQSGPGNGARWIAFYVPSEESESPEVVCKSFNAGGTYRGIDHFSGFERSTSNLNAGKCTSNDPVLGYGFYTIGYYCKNLVTLTESQGPCPTSPGSCPGVGVGNPTELPSGVKTESATDWLSSLDGRFSIRRSYRSDPANAYVFGQAGTSENPKVTSEKGMYTHGLIWRNSFDEIAKWTSTPSPGKISYYAWDGQNIEMPDNGTAGVARGGQPYTGTRPSGKIIIEDGKGTKFNFNTKTWPGGSFARYRLDEIVWADGYKITVSRSSTDNRINVLSDNRGQRAEFIWGPVVANSTVSFLQEVRIDSAYNGSVLNPQIKVVYSYTANASFPDFPLLTQVLTRDGTQTSGGKILVAYAYGSDAEKLPPNLISKSDDRQNTGLTTPYATFTYEAGSPRVLSSTHAGNVDRFDFTYGAFGATSIDATNARGLKTTYSFSQVDGIYRLSQVQGAATVNCLGTATSASYTPNAANPSAPPGYIYERTEKNGSKTRFIRDSRGLVLTKTENATGSSPRVTTYTWHATLRLPLTRTTSQAAETFTYSSTGQLLTYSKTDKLAGSPTFDQVRTWTYTYTTLASGFKVLTSVDGPGLTGDGITDVTSFTYSASGALASVTDALGLVTTVQAVNQQGQPTQVLAADGVTWAFTYDLFGRLLTSTVYAGSAGAKTSTYAYDSIGQLVSLTNSLAKIWTFEYNDARQMTKATSPSGDVARYSYDTLGNVTLTEYGTGAPTTAFYEDTQFDELGRLLKTLGAQGQVFQFSHDVEDNLSTVTDSLNYVETNGYDPLNRLIQVIDREGFTTAMASNDSDLMTQYTDPRSIQTQFTYNGFGETITEVSADRGTIFYTYDRRGLVKTMTDARGIVTTYSYDNADNLTLIDYPTGVTPDIALAYGTTNGSNTAGKLRSVTQGTVLTDTITYPFNTSVGTLRVVEVLGYPGARSYTVDTTFDTEGNIKVIDYPSGDRIDFLYDDDNRVTRVRLRPSGSSTWENLVTSVDYLPNGPVADLTFGDLYNQFRSYDSSYRLTRLRDTKSGSPTLRDVSMGYSLVDNLTSITDAQNAANDETFGYTPRENLSTATGPYG